ncbi:MAG: hypothetical protein DCF22_19625 [Leptolyngbya sp.]|nr:MAG: hypothetical protein DCF22_19625 [Leptolyngbya sp.]
MVITLNPNKQVIPEQIDQLLADWKTRLDLASQNMLALQGLTTYQRLAGEAGFSKTQLTGTTAVQVAAALDAMNQVFQHFDLLLATINRAAELRKQFPRFLGSDQKYQEVEALLLGQSIHLSVVQVPLAQRSLLSAAETTCTVTPDNLLAMMTLTFETARDTILAIDVAWSRLEPILCQVEAEIQALQQQANALGVKDLTNLKVVQQTIASLRDQVTTDPLGVKDEFEQQIQPLIERVKDSLNQVLQQHNQIQDELAIAHALLQNLTELNQQTHTAYAESLEKVTDHSGLQPPLSADHLDALCQWLSRLETRFAEGLVNPIQVGLENWTAKVKAAIAIEQCAVTANRHPLETRRELRGRLEALKAKALARGRAEDPMLAALSIQAKQLLYTRPTDLAKAIELVTQYEKHLNNR